MAKKKGSKVSSIVSNPFYEVVIQTIIKFAEDSVHNPDSRDEMKKALQPLYNALQDLYGGNSK